MTGDVMNLPHAEAGSNLSIDTLRSGNAAAGVTKAARQGERAARFWNDYYKPEEDEHSNSIRNRSTISSVATPFTTGSEKDKHHEWICKPDALMSLLPLKLPDGELN